MHTCPICGMDCDCGGDLDDAAVMSDDWVMEQCQCDHEDRGLNNEKFPLDDERFPGGKDEP